MQEKKSQNSRRRFIKQLSGTTLAFTAGSLAAFAAEEKLNERIINYSKRIAVNDNINIAVIGVGIMGNNNLTTTLKVPGVKLVAACDLYKGRLERIKEVYGDNIFLTNDYRKILARKDIDAVIIATADLWHARITKEALEAGKHVYCEKPMVHLINEGLGIIEAQKKYNKVLQVGSQRVSSIVYAKAHELYKAGEIGKLNMVNASFDRQDALGAWQYTMPTDGSLQTVDWDKYIAGMPHIPYDPKKFFWWRNYKDFGTGVAGDLFVHLISGTHVITGSKGPNKIFSSGQLSYWKDGRDVPDVMSAIMQYPHTSDHASFMLNLQVNFVSGTGGMENVKFIGEEGTLEVRDNRLIIQHNIMPKAPGIGGWDALTTYPKAMQETLKAQYDQKYSKEEQTRPKKADVTFRAPEGYDEHLDHHTNFYESIRSGKPVKEDATFGFRAAAPCLACNDSYFSKKIVNWDPESMKVISV